MSVEETICSRRAIPHEIASYATPDELKGAAAAAPRRQKSWKRRKECKRQRERGKEEAENNKLKKYRLAVVVSKKVSKSAVKRNRIRRRLYSCFEEFENDIVRPSEVVITVFSEEIADLDWQKLKTNLGQLLTQAGIIAKRLN